MTISSQTPEPRDPHGTGLSRGTGRPDGITPEPARSSRTPDRTRTPDRSQPAFATFGSPYFAYLIALFVGVMLISNVTGTKGVLLFPDLSFQLGFVSVDGLVTDGAFLLFPLAYVLGDVILSLIHI